MGPICGRQDPGGPYVGPMNFASRDAFADVAHKNWRAPIMDELKNAFCSTHYMVGLRACLLFIAKALHNLANVDC